MVYSRTGNAVKHLLRFLGGRSFLTVLLAAFIGLYAYYITDIINTVYIVDGEGTQVALTTSSDYEALLDDGAVSTSPMSEIVRQNGNGFAMLSVRRGISVSLTMDGVTSTYTIAETPFTVADLLRLAGVELTSDEHCSLPLSHELIDGEGVIITSIGGSTVEEYEPIPFETQYRSTSLIRSGRERVITEGIDGKRRSVYQILTDDDGNEVSKELLYSEVIEAPQTQLTLIGDGSPISRIDWSDEFPIGEDGLPTEYITVLHNKKATGYYFGAGCWGSSGGYCYAGTAAVQLGMFPYGTKMYVVSHNPDSEFVYGYTIANDTGGLEYVDIDLDLFYETYAESALNGLKYVDIYVLEWGDGTIN